MKTVIIIKAGSTFPITRQRFGDFEDWIIRSIGGSEILISVINVLEGETLPPVETLSGVIITGSHGMVTDNETWMQVLTSWIPKVMECNIPLLGICFGHQLLAMAMGGYSDYHPKGREIGTVSIKLSPEGRQDRLLGYLPDEFKAHTTHAQTIIKLPEHALTLAANPFEAHHAFRLGDSAWGVQFHPEFSADIMKAYINEQAVTLQREGHDVAELTATICNTDAANRLFNRFIAIVQEQA
ncbi:MAG: glutamine amidotransferase [Methylococcaceae bacterium]